MTKTSTAQFPLRNTDHPLSCITQVSKLERVIICYAIRTYDADENARYHCVPGRKWLEVAVEREICPIDVLGLETSIESKVSQADAKPG